MKEALSESGRSIHKAEIYEKKRGRQHQSYLLQLQVDMTPLPAVVVHPSTCHPIYGLGTHYSRHWKYNDETRSLPS